MRLQDRFLEGRFGCFLTPNIHKVKKPHRVDVFSKMHVKTNIGIYNLYIYNFILYIIFFIFFLLLMISWLFRWLSRIFQSFRIFAQWYIYILWKASSLKPGNSIMNLTTLDTTTQIQVQSVKPFMTYRHRVCTCAVCTNAGEDVFHSCRMEIAQLMYP